MTPDHEHLLRELAPRVLGSLIRRYRNFADAEDAVQEALLAAAKQWPSEGVPDNPQGWLTQVACSNVVDGRPSQRSHREAVRMTIC